MPDSYRYIDPDYKYTDKNGVLRNLLGISNQETLIFVESGLVAKRLKELYDRPIKITGIESLFMSTMILQPIYFSSSSSTLRSVFSNDRFLY